MFLNNKKVTKKLFDQIMREGVCFYGTFFTFRVIINKNNPKYAIVAPKSVAKTAVDRNKLKRVGYSALRGFGIKNSQGILFYKKNNLKIPFVEIKKDINFLLNKAKLI